MQVIKRAEFTEIIKEGVSVIDFFATWCGPCKMLSPILEEVSKEMPDVKIAKVDVDESSDLAQEYGIMSIPCVYVFKDGKEMGHFTGLQPKEAIIKFIEKYK